MKHLKIKENRNFKIAELETGNLLQKFVNNEIPMIIQYNGTLIEFIYKNTKVYIKLDVDKEVVKEIVEELETFFYGEFQ